MSLNSTQKTAITTAITALNTAITGVKTAIQPSLADQAYVNSLIGDLQNISASLASEANTHIAKG